MDRPIIFSGPMVRALLDGRKTQTRRLAWRDPHEGGPADGLERRPSSWRKVQPGDRLWVRERCWSDYQGADGNGVRYQADGEWIKATDEERWAALDCYAHARHPDNATNTGQLVPSIHMPRWASRLTLAITDVRVQRLHEISEADAQAEGTTPFGEYRPSHISAFRSLWNHLHGFGAWDANPEVLALTFTVARRS
jgi:hypothetical protein